MYLGEYTMLTDLLDQKNWTGKTLDVVAHILSLVLRRWKEEI